MSTTDDVDAGGKTKADLKEELQLLLLAANESVKADDYTRVKQRLNESRGLAHRLEVEDA